MNGADPKALAERLLLYWSDPVRGEAESVDGALAERLLASLSPSNSRALRQAPAENRLLLEQALSTLIETDPITRDLARRPVKPAAAAAAPPNPSSPGYMAAPTSSAAGHPSIQSSHNYGVITAGDVSGFTINSAHSAPPQASPAAPPAAAPARDPQAVISILFLGASPDDLTRLHLDREVRDIESALRDATLRDRFSFHQEWAVRLEDLQGCLLRHRPNIVHFSGHGSSQNALYFEDHTGLSRPLAGAVLNRLLAVFKKLLRCVVLNACHSEEQAQAIAEHVDCVIGMSTAIGDRAAIAFATSFYRALAHGSDVQAAFDLGCIQISMIGLSEEDTPRLIAKRRSPSEIFLLE